MNPPIYYIPRVVLILAIALCLFGIVLIAWTRWFGVPCWAFNGGSINDSITREVIARCSQFIQNRKMEEKEFTKEEMRFVMQIADSGFEEECVERWDEIERRCGRKPQKI